MAKIKFSKMELKSQRDQLKRYLRFLPTLELKKEQLLQEIRRVEDRLDKKREEEARVWHRARHWVKLFSEPVELDRLVRINYVEVVEGNIAGVPIPVYKKTHFTVADYDLYAMPLWVDDAVELVCRLASLRAEEQVLVRQREMLAHELRITTQRVNLFDKVKIPECRENIRRIIIYLGDQQTSAVVRGKISKNKLSEINIPEFA